MRARRLVGLAFCLSVLFLALVIPITAQEGPAGNPRTHPDAQAPPPRQPFPFPVWFPPGSRVLGLEIDPWLDPESREQWWHITYAATVPGTIEKIAAFYKAKYKQHRPKVDSIPGPKVLEPTRNRLIQVGLLQRPDDLIARLVVNVRQYPYPHEVKLYGLNRREAKQPFVKIWMFPPLMEALAAEDRDILLPLPNLPPLKDASVVRPRVFK